MNLNNSLNDLRLRSDEVLIPKSSTFVLITPNITDAVSIAT